jgi:hypothetical protein
VSAFVVTLTIGILALAGLTLDGGLALAAAVRADGQAEAAARGGGTLRLMPVQAVANAQAHLAAEGATGTVTVTGDTVAVTVTASQPTQLLGLVGIDSLSVHGQGSAQPQRE